MHQDSVGPGMLIATLIFIVQGRCAHSGVCVAFVLHLSAVSP